MLYILRLTNGECIVVLADDEMSARAITARFTSNEGAAVASVRRLEGFAVQFSPTDEGSLAVSDWDDTTLDDILTCEYPLLNEAYRRANAEPFLQSPNRHEPIFSQLRAAHERNTEIIREGLRQERQRSGQGDVSTRSKAAATARR